jgi:hypothetical protein
MMVSFEWPKADPAELAIRLECIRMASQHAGNESETAELAARLYRTIRDEKFWRVSESGRSS